MKLLEFSLVNLNLTDFFKTYANLPGGTKIYWNLLEFT